LHDLYVVPAFRGRGFARAMIETLKTMGKREKWRYLFWKARADAHAAQKLYDSIVERTDRVYYELRFDP
jgi:ribosomal protein S18 acetylase RimI-like enzyme